MPVFGANLWIWDSPVTTAVIRSRVPQVAAMGFDLVELPLENAGDWRAQDVRAVIEAYGLKVVVCAAMAPGRDLTTSDAATVAATLSYLSACVEAAAELGAGVVAGPMYAPTGRTGPIDDIARTDQIARVAEGLRPVLDRADRAGVRLAIEPLNRFETSLFNTVEQTMALVEAIDHPAAGLLLDTFHMNIEERDIAAAIRLAGDRLVHFHACGNDRGAPGPGPIDWPGIVATLREIDYRVAISIESFTAANRTIATAASIWRPLAASQDALARDGLAFLRDLFGSWRRES